MMEYQPVEGFLPDKRSHIILIRHGDSPSNAHFGGKEGEAKPGFDEDLPLDAEGRRKVDLRGILLGIQLAEVPKRDIVIASSDLQRARESTGWIIPGINRQRNHPDEKIKLEEVNFTHALSERDMGVANPGYKTLSLTSDDREERRLRKIFEWALEAFKKRTKENPRTKFEKPVQFKPNRRDPNKPGRDEKFIRKVFNRGSQKAPEAHITGESFEDVIWRVLPFFESQIYNPLNEESWQKKHIIIVSHDMAISALRFWIIYYKRLDEGQITFAQAIEEAKTEMLKKPPKEETQRAEESQQKHWESLWRGGQLHFAYNHTEEQFHFVEHYGFKDSFSEEAIKLKIQHGYIDEIDINRLDQEQRLQVLFGMMENCLISNKTTHVRYTVNSRKAQNSLQTFEYLVSKDKLEKSGQQIERIINVYIHMVERLEESLPDLLEGSIMYLVNAGERLLENGFIVNREYARRIQEAWAKVKPTDNLRIFGIEGYLRKLSAV